VIQHVRSATPGIRHVDAIEEALCFGWIDSLARKRDATSWCLRFTPRNPRAAWSNVNRDRVERLTAQGLITPHGQAAVELAKQTGTWAMLADAQNGIVRRRGSAASRGPSNAPRATCDRDNLAVPSGPHSAGYPAGCAGNRAGRWGR